MLSSKPYTGSTPNSSNMTIGNAIHGLANDSPITTLINIEMAAWAARKRGLNSIRLYLHPQSIIRPTEGFNKWIIAKTKAFIAPFRNLQYQSQPPLQLICQRKLDTSVILHGVKVEVKTVLLSRKARLSLIANALQTVRTDLGLLKSNNRKRLIKCLTYKIDQVSIGLAAASTCLRSDVLAGGSLSKAPFLLLSIIDSVSIYLYLTKFLSSVEGHAFGVVDTTYNGRIYAQYFLNRGGNFVSYNIPGNKYTLISDPDFSIDEERIIKKSDNALTSSERELCRNYLQHRVNDPREVLTYMKNAHIDTGLEDVNVNDLFHKSHELETQFVAVIFLHSVSDAGYLFGHDGFIDLSEWCFMTIDHLLLNPNCLKIIIKPHPNVDLIYRPADLCFAFRLRTKYILTKKVVFASSGLTIDYLSKLPRFIGITHHGSVAEELAFLHKPVIASTKGPWGNSYKFLNLWQDPADYLHMLNALPHGIKFRLTNCDQIELLKYIRDSRLNVEKDYSKSYVSSLNNKVLTLSRSKRKKAAISLLNKHNSHCLDELLPDLPKI